MLRGAVDWLLAAIVLATAEATVLTIGVGAVLRTYERWAILLGVLVWAAVAWLACRLRRASWDGARAARDSARRRPGRALVVAVVARRPRERSRSPGVRSWRSLLPPFAYDALVYHLTIVADWVASGRVDVNRYVTCCSHYPSGAEALFAWPALFLGRDLLVDAVQIVLAVTAALAVAGLARWLGLPRASAVTAGALLAVTPIVLTQANTPYNDVAVAAFLLSALFFLARLLDAGSFRFGTASERSPSLSLALLAGVSTGLVLGAKTSGLVVVAVLGTLVGAQLVDAAIRHPGARRRLAGCAALFLSATLLVGVLVVRPQLGRDRETRSGPSASRSATRRCFEALRRWRSTSRLPRAAAAGRSRSRAPGTTTSRSGPDRDYSYEERSGGLGPLWGWLGWGGVAVLAWYGLRRRHDVLVNLLLPLLAIFVALPYKWWSRFTIFLPALGALGILLVLERLRSRPLRTAAVSAVVVLAVAGVARASWWLDPAGRGTRLAAPEVLELAAHPRRDRTVGTLFFPEYGFLPSLPPSSSVAFERDAPSIRFAYPFFGSELDRAVTILRPGDEQRLGSILTEAEADYVAVATGRALDRRLTAARGSWRRIFDERGVRVYRRLGR